MQAQEIMTTDVVTVTPETSVEEAAKILSKRGVSGLPVVEDDKLVGIVSEKDLIVKDKKLHFPDYINILGGIIYLESHKKFEEDFKKFIATKVKDLMSTEIITIKPDTPVEEIATLMTEQGVNRIPVLADNKLVGIVTRSDVVRHIASTEG